MKWKGSEAAQWICGQGRGFSAGVDMVRGEGGYTTWVEMWSGFAAVGSGKMAADGVKAIRSKRQLVSTMSAIPRNCVTI